MTTTPPSADAPARGKLPGAFKRFSQRFPELVETHERVGRLVGSHGPLDEVTCELVKIGLCVGAGLESALRAHVRKATAAGATAQQIEQAILLGMNTCGFPRTVAAWQWAQEQFERDRLEREENQS